MELAIIAHQRCAMIANVHRKVMNDFDMQHACKLLDYFDYCEVLKGQLVSKCPFGVFKSPKKPGKFFPGFLPYPLKRGQMKKTRALYTTNWRISSYTTFQI